MKLLIFKLSAAAVLITATGAAAQTKVYSSSNVQVQTVNPDTAAKRNDGFDENNLPGHNYGLDINVEKPPKLPKDPQSPRPDKIRADLSINLKKDGPFIQELCSDYFTVNYKMILENRHGEGPITFKVLVKDGYDNLMGSQEGTNNYPVNFVTVNPETTDTLRGSIRLSYPFILNNLTKGSGNSTQYISKHLVISAQIVGGFANGAILDDPKRENNEDVITIDTPLPPKCIQMNQPQTN